MFIKALSFFGFRNLKDATISFEERINVFIGKNAQGKTSIVEGLSFLGLGKSFRSSKAEEIVCFGKEAASVFGIVETEDQGELQLGVSIENGRKSFFLNGKKTKNTAEFIGKVPLVIFTPADLFLIQGGPAERRDFIDNYASQLFLQHEARLAMYAEALRNKNALLKSERATPEQLVPWNEILAREGTEIFLARERFIEKLLPHLQRTHGALFAIDGVLTIETSSRLSDVIRDEVQHRNFLNTSSGKEIAAGMSLYGVHRDDFIFLLSGREAKSFASQGQTRSVVLALLLSVIDLLAAEHSGAYPIVVLDDVASELDQSRSESFFEKLLSRDGQVFITGTDHSLEGVKSVSQACKLYVVSGEVCAKHEKATEFGAENAYK